MLLAMLAVQPFKDAPPLEVAIVLVIAFLMGWMLWVGARHGKNNPPRPPAGDQNLPDA